MATWEPCSLVELLMPGWWHYHMILLAGVARITIYLVQCSLTSKSWDFMGIKKNRCLNRCTLVGGKKHQNI